MRKTKALHLVNTMIDLEVEAANLSEEELARVRDLLDSIREDVIGLVNEIFAECTPNFDDYVEDARLVANEGDKRFEQR